MEDTIKIQFNSLKAAVEAFEKMEEQISPRGYLNSELVNESRGQTYEAVTRCYKELIAIEQSLALLVANTRMALVRAGIQFTDAENDAVQTFNGIGDTDSAR